MIKITSPIQDTLLYTNKIFVEYEVTDNSKFTEKVVFYVDSTKFERTDLKGRFEVPNLMEGKHTIRAYLTNKYNKKIIGSETKFYFYTNDDVIQIKNKLSTVLSSQIPEFIRKDYDKFVKFIEHYYAFLEQSNDPKLIPFSSYEFSDVDSTPDFFIDRFRKEFIPDFPEELTRDIQTGKPLNLKTLIKRASEFYRSKGTQNSFNFLFRILFDQNIDFYYPREHMFIVSGARWTEKSVLKLLVASGDGRPRRFIDRQIYQTNDVGQIIATARVLNVTLYKQSPYDVAELEIAEIIGEFTDEYQISCDIIEDDAEETISYYPTRGIKSVTVLTSGFNYKQGDRVTLEPINGQGVGYTGTVDVTGPRGEIYSIVTVNFGVNYEENLTGKYTLTVLSENGIGFTGTPISSVLSEYEGYYSSNNGVISDRSFIQDNDYYQTHSYEIISSLPLSSYYDVVRRMVHPAGYKMFGSQIVQERIALQPTVQDYDSSITQISSYYIGNYIAYRINGDVNLRDTTLDLNENIDLFPQGINITREIPPNSDGYFIHDPRNEPEIRDISAAYFENYVDISPLIPDWDQRYTYWVVFPHPSVLINNTNASIGEFYNLKIEDLAVIEETNI